MLVTVKYFGMVLEKTNTSSENIGFPDTDTSISDIENLILEKYPTLSQLTYNIACNQKIASKDTLINQGDELAFLPPFAGG
ncbi:MoaD/ThiS family protein [Wenyingzhuangia sp. IMCC45533]